MSKSLIMGGAAISAMASISGDSSLPLRVMADGRIDIGAMRPFFTEDGEARIAINAEGDTELATNALLQYQEWLDIDRAVIATLGQRMTGIDDLRRANLVHNLGSIGQTVTMWQTASEMTEANVSMDGVTAGEEDTPAFGTAQVPVPIIHKDWRLNMRRLAASRMFGESLDVTAAAAAGRVVAEASERMLFSGAPIRVEGSSIYGYLNFPGRTQIDLAVNWLTASPAQIKADVLAMVDAMRRNRFYGSFVLYIPNIWETVLDEFYIDPGIVGTGRTIREVLLSISGVDAITVADMMGSSPQAVLVSLTRETVDLAIAQEPTTISWQEMGGMQDRFKTMAVWVPRIKSDYDGRTGIVHLRPA